ncbi:MAG: polyprenyl synthetase family protein [Anaerolineales bacterium]|jgi:geranylgeranyl pyrophosphate synthase
MSFAWPGLVSAMQLVIPEPGEKTDSQRDPARWVTLPGLCCQAVGGRPNSTLEVSAAWFLLFTAAHIVDSIEDGDNDPLINKLGGTGVAINTTNGLFLSAVMLLQSMDAKEIPKGLVAKITADYLETILGMTSGQHLDLTLQEISLDQWWQIAEAKSGAFFSLACRSGAQFGTSDPLKVHAFSEYGFHVGLMLQIMDDLEDFQLLLNSGEIASPRSLERSLAAAYAHEILPSAIKEEFTQLIRIGAAGEEMSDRFLDILDECGAGLYMVAELEKHYELGMAALREAQPASPALEKLEEIIGVLKAN